MWNEKKRTEKKHKTSHFWHLKKKKTTGFFESNLLSKNIMFYVKKQRIKRFRSKGIHVKCWGYLPGGKGGKYKNPAIGGGFLGLGGHIHLDACARGKN